MTKPQTEPVNTTSTDINEERLTQLRHLIPEAFTEGKIDFEKLRVTLGDTVDDSPERYSFTWAGKRDAIKLLQTPTSATLVPARDESINFDDTSHIFIEGENLEVLKLLYKAYFGKVKMIYIDPPYNTGNDFIYPDNYAAPLDPYLRLTGQKDDEGNLLTSNTDSSGRYHSNWLNMMYPRLFIARQLLSEDGALFISIDDNEMHHLRILLSNIFGDENFVANIVWQAKDTPGNDSSDVASTHNYIICYRKTNKFKAALLPRTKKQLKNYKNPDNDPRGPWLPVPLTRGEFRPRDHYSLTNPKGEEVWPPPGNSWRRPKETIKELEKDNRIWWGKDGTSTFPFMKKFLSEVKSGVVPITWWDYKFAGSTRRARAEMKKLFKGERGFDTPKPSQLINRIIQMMDSVEKNYIVMDFFSGSSTTAQAVLEKNQKDGGKRQFVMVQLPEPTSKGNYNTIADISKERVRRVIQQIKSSGEGKFNFPQNTQSLDLGFRVFKLTSSHFKPWSGSPNADPDTYNQQLDLFRDPLIEGWQPEPVVWEAAIKEGYPLHSRITQANAAGHIVYRVTNPDNDQQFHICLESEITAEIPRQLGLTTDDLFICRDLALDDTTAANLALQCRLKTI